MRSPPLPAGATLAERKLWVESHVDLATYRVGSANIRSAAAGDFVAIVAVASNGNLSYGYVSRAQYPSDFPSAVQLKPGESAACWAILVDAGSPGGDAHYRAFRMARVERSATTTPQG
jgi:hypothetical protein